MDNIKVNKDERTLIKLTRPTTLDNLVQTNIGCNEKVEIIDICTPNMDVNDNVIKSTSTTIDDRFPNLRRRLSILPCYPTNNKHGQGDPLLPNIPRMYQR